MIITTGKKAGFCMGVRRAMDMMLTLLNSSDRAIYTFGPLIHNQQVIDALNARNVKVISLSDNVRAGVVVIRAHGVPPAEYEALRERGLEIVDATCPKVRAVQKIIEKHYQKGYQIAIIGDKGHAEVTGLCGYADNTAVVIETAADIENTQWSDRVCIVTQTTQSEDRVKEFSDIIHQQVKDCIFFNTVCKSTHDRQDEVITLAGKVDAMVVIGGKNSGNTVRLAELSQEKKIPTYHVETADELNHEELLQYRHIGVTAGASTPNWIIIQVIEALNSIKQQNSLFSFSGILKFLFSCGIGAGMFAFLTAFSVQAAFSVYSKKIMVSSCLFMMLTDIIRRYLKKSLMHTVQKNDRYPLFFWSMLLGGFLYLICMHAFNRTILFFVLGALVFNIMQHFFRVLRKFYYTQTILSSASLAMLTVLLLPRSAESVIVFFTVFLFFLLYYVVNEYMSYEIDSITGIRTLAVIGKGDSYLINIIMALCAGIICASVYTHSFKALYYIPGILCLLGIHAYLLKKRFVNAWKIELYAVCAGIPALFFIF